VDILKEHQWPNPFQSSAIEEATPVTGPTGLKMRGPYEYVAPSYWLTDTKRGGAFSFNTETGPGPAVPPVESIRKMLPASHLWPIDEYWDYHTGGGPFSNLKVFTEALEARYGKAKGLEDYAMKAQVLAYESHRAMFEAFGRNKYTGTGVIQWMLNNAWPSMIWHLYDYYLRPGGSYFGTKKGCDTGDCGARRPVDRGRQFLLPAAQPIEGHGEGLQPGHDREVLEGSRPRRRRGQHQPGFCDSRD